MTTQPLAWMFVAPAVAVIALFFAVPVAAGLALSFTDFDLYALADTANLRFAGLDNYAHLLSLPLFWRSLGNTLYFVAAGVPLSIALSLGCAVLLQSPLARWKPLFRTALFAPVVTTLVAVAVVWRYLFHTRYGLFNEWLGAFGIDAIDWLGDPHWAMPSIIFFSVWKGFGANMIIFVAALAAIPEELYEAARIDGASRWRQFVDVTLPMLGPTLFLVSVLTMTGYFQLFAEPYVMTQGGPLESTVSVLYLMYEEGFRWWNLGRASAVAFMLFALMIAVTRGLMWANARREATMSAPSPRSAPHLPAASGHAGPDRSAGSPHAARNPRSAPNPLPRGERRRRSPSGRTTAPHPNPLPKGRGSKK